MDRVDRTTSRSQTPQIYTVLLTFASYMPDFRRKLQRNIKDTGYIVDKLNCPNHNILSALKISDWDQTSFRTCFREKKITGKNKSYMVRFISACKIFKVVFYLTVGEQQGPRGRTVPPSVDLRLGFHFQLFTPAMIYLYSGNFMINMGIRPLQVGSF